MAAPVQSQNCREKHQHKYSTSVLVRVFRQCSTSAVPLRCLRCKHVVPLGYHCALPVQRSGGVKSCSPKAFPRQRANEQRRALLGRHGLRRRHGLFLRQLLGVDAGVGRPRRRQPVHGPLPLLLLALGGRGFQRRHLHGRGRELHRGAGDESAGASSAPPASPEEPAPEDPTGKSAAPSPAGEDSAGGEEAAGATQDSLDANTGEEDEEVIFRGECKLWKLVRESEKQRGEEAADAPGADAAAGGSTPSATSASVEGKDWEAPGAQLRLWSIGG